MTATEGKRPRRWRRRFLRAGLVVLALGVLVRVTLPLWLPALLDRVVSGRGLALTYKDLDLSTFGGRLDLRGVSLAPRAEEGEPEPQELAHLDYVGFDLDVSALFTGTLRMHRLDVDGLDLHLERDGHGQWNIDPYLTGAEETADTESAPATETPDGAAESEPTESAPGEPTPAGPGEAEPLDFSSPIQIDAIGIRSFRLRLVDALAAPPLDTHFDLDLALTDVGYPGETARLTVSAFAPQLLDALRVEALAQTSDRELTCTFSVELAGLGVARLAPYLEPLGVRPHAKAIGMSLTGGVDLRREEAAVDFTGNVQLEGLVLRSDLGEAFALDAVTVEVTRANSSATVLSTVLVKGLRAGAERLADGTLRVAGLDLVGGSAQPTEEVEEEADPDETPEASSYALEIGRFALENAEIRLDDAAVAPAAAVQITAGVEVRDIVIDPARPAVPVALDATMTIADAGRFTLAGTVTPGGAEPGADLTVRADELTLTAVAPYLAAAGLEPTFEGGVFQATIQVSAPVRADGGLDASFGLSALTLTDGGAELLGVEAIEVRGVHLDPDGTTRVDELRLAGVRAPVRFADDGTTHLLGVATQGAGAPQTREPFELRLSELDLSLRDLALGGPETGAARRRAELAFSCAVDDLVDTFEVNGSIASLPGPLDIELDLAIRGAGLRADAVQTLLDEAGIESTLTGADFTLQAVAALRVEGEVTRASATLRDVAFQDSGREFVALDLLELDRLVAGPNGVTIAATNVRGARAALGRGADGAIEALGLRILAQETQETEEGAARSTPPAGRASATTTAPEPAADPAQPEPAPFALDLLTLQEARITWNDAAVEPAVETALDLSARVEGLTTARGARPLTLDLRGALAGALEEMALTGTARLAPDDLGLEVQLALTGMRAGALASYLPPELPVLLNDGRFGLRLEASSSAHPEGGRKVELVVDELDYRDGVDGEPLLAFEGLRVSAPRIDADAGVYDIERFSVEGLAFDVLRTSPERIEVLGVALVTPPPGTEAETSAEPAASTEPAQPAVPATGDAGAAIGVRPPPTVRLGMLDIGIERLRYRDTSGGGDEPLDLSLSLVTPGPQELCRPEPEGLAPIELAIVGSVAPLVDSIEARLSAAPYLSEPEVSVDFGVRGVHGDQLERVLPDLAASLDATAFEAGEFTGALEARLRMQRRGPVDFDLSRGFGAELTVTDVALRPSPDGEVLAGFERLDVEVQRVRPATGDVHIASIELSGTRARVTQEAGGMRVAGVLLRTPPAGAESAEQEPVAAPAQGEDDPAPAPAESTVDPGPEIKIDRILMSGLDFEFLDTTVEPPLLLPIADLELEVSRFTTRALTEPRPVSFRAVVDAGTVELPERTGADNLLAGVAGSVAGAIGGAEDTFAVEQRPLWDLFEVAGRLKLAPHLAGRVKVELIGLELPAFSGAAAASGVSIGDGLLDSTATLRFREDGGLSIDSKTVTDYLSLSEPPGGPISQYLVLPAPLDTVLFLLRDEAGRQNLPLRLDVGPDGVGGGKVAAAIAETLGQLIVDALSGAPLRLLGPLTDVVKLTGHTAVPISAETVRVPYAAGAALVSAEELAVLNPLIAALKFDPDLRVVVQHELGGGDIRVAEGLANPSSEDGDALAIRLHDRKRAIERERGEIAALTRAQYAVGRLEEAAEGTLRLKVLDRERATVEAGLDRVFELTRPGAERRRDRRTRIAALALAQQRLDRMRAELAARSGRGVAQRIDFRRPRWTPVEGDEGGRITLTPRPPK